MAPTAPIPPMNLTTLVLAVGVLGGGMLVSQRQRANAAANADADAQPPGNILASAGVVPGTDTAPATAPKATQALGASRVKDLNGKVVPLVPAGTPAILMISSRTCSWCKRSLKDLGELSAGRPLPRLTVLTLEGASEGVPMLAKEQLTGARLVGPASSSEEVLLTFRYPGTPTFVAIDRNGRVVRTIPGYPIRDEMKRLWAVMVGDATAP